MYLKISAALLIAALNYSVESFAAPATSGGMEGTTPATMPKTTSDTANETVREQPGAVKMKDKKVVPKSEMNKGRAHSRNTQEKNRKGLKEGEPGTVTPMDQLEREEGDTSRD